LLGVSALFGHDQQSTCHRLDADTAYGIPEAQRLATERAHAALGDQIRALDEATYTGEYAHDARVTACHTAASDGVDQRAP
jgi:hypothetical protein